MGVELNLDKKRRVNVLKDEAFVFLGFDFRRVLKQSRTDYFIKLFIEFIALIYLSYIKKQMQVHDLFKTYTLQGVFDKLEVIECFVNPGQKLRVGEVLEKQKTLYADLGIAPPTSL